MADEKGQSNSRHTAHLIVPDLESPALNSKTMRKAKTQSKNGVVIDQMAVCSRTWY